jgi:ABC-type dipeptide/oligopeptide/nickel transport system ATPase subunit
MKIIKITFDTEQLTQIYVYLIKTFNVKDETKQQYIFNILMTYKDMSNTLDNRSKINDLINNYLQIKKYSNDEFEENNKIEKILEELLY